MSSFHDLVAKMSPMLGDDYDPRDPKDPAPVKEAKTTDVSADDVKAHMAESVKILGLK